MKQGECTLHREESRIQDEAGHQSNSITFGIDGAYFGRSENIQLENQAPLQTRCHHADKQMTHATSEFTGLQQAVQGECNEVPIRQDEDEEHSIVHTSRTTDASLSLDENSQRESDALMQTGDQQANQQKTCRAAPAFTFSKEVNPYT